MPAVGGAVELLLVHNDRRPIDAHRIVDARDKDQQPHVRVGNCGRPKRSCQPEHTTGVRAGFNELALWDPGRELPFPTRLPLIIVIAIVIIVIVVDDGQVIRDVERKAGSIRREVDRMLPVR